MQEARQMKKPQWILVGITAAFCCVLIGLFVGRNTTHTYIPVNSAIQSQTEASTGIHQSNDGKINLNTATAQQLMLLPGVGETTAQKIIEYRTENDGFTTIEDIMKVNGIGEKKFEQLKPYIKVD
jgi:competence protein ComEA